MEYKSRRVQFLKAKRKVFNIQGIGYRYDIKEHENYTKFVGVQDFVQSKKS